MIGIMSWPRQTQHLKYVYRYVGGCDSWQQADNSNILLIINDGEWAVYGQRGPVQWAQPGSVGVTCANIGALGTFIETEHETCSTCPGLEALNILPKLGLFSYQNTAWKGGVSTECTYCIRSGYLVSGSCKYAGDEWASLCWVRGEINKYSWCRY